MNHDQVLLLGVVAWIVFGLACVQYGAKVNRYMHPSAVWFALMGPMFIVLVLIVGAMDVWAKRKAKREGGHDE